MEEHNTNNSYRKYFTEIKILEGAYVTEGIGNDFLEWSNIEPVFLACSTGTGKTHFSENVLVKTCSETNSNVLILTNRHSTDNAARNRLEEILELDENPLHNYSMMDYKNPYDINKKNNVYVMTYQSLAKLIESKKIYKNKIKFKLVIIDEAQFFLTDSLYNYKTHFILDFVVQYFKDSIRLYLSATPDPIFTEIYHVEQHYYNKRPYNSIPGLSNCFSCDFTKFKSLTLCNGTYCLHRSITSRLNNTIYPFKDSKLKILAYELIKDYKYLNIRYSNNLDEIAKVINENKIEKNKKWVIFVSKKDDGTSLQKLIKDSIYIDAETKYRKDDDENKKAYNYLIEHENFTQKVLICTSVFDNGINITKKDKSITNIVIDTEDKNQFIQMLGRKRVDEGDKLNLYIINQQELKKRLNNVNLKLRAIFEFNNTYRPSFEDKYYNDSSAEYNFDIIHGFFYVKNGSIGYNVLAEKQLYYLKELLEDIIEKSKIEKNKKDYNQAYIKTVLSWLGREDDYKEENWLDYNKNEEHQLAFKKDLINYLEEINGIEFEKKDQFYTDLKKNFKEKISSLYAPLKKNEKVEQYGVDRINQALEREALGYRIEKKEKEIIGISGKSLKKMKKYYVLEKINISIP